MQYYQDNTLGYLGIDGNEHWKYSNKAKVLYTGELENIAMKYAISDNQYGSNEALDKLVNDDDWHVRLLAAELGYGFDKLYTDKSYHVREEIAKQGYASHVFVKDPNVKVRLALAKNGICTDVLVHDKSKDVRLEIAKQGKEIYTLIRDKWFDVFDAAFSYVFNHLEDYSEYELVQMIEFARNHIIDAVNSHPEWDVRFPKFGCKEEVKCLDTAKIRDILYVSRQKYVGALLVLLRNEKYNKYVYTNINSGDILHMINMIHLFRA